MKISNMINNILNNVQQKLIDKYDTFEDNYYVSVGIAFDNETNDHDVWTVWLSVCKMNVEEVSYIAVVNGNRDYDGHTLYNAVEKLFDDVLDCDIVLSAVRAVDEDSCKKLPLPE
jgi:hypothetical protein